MLDDFHRGNKVCLLKKALYGLRQAGRNWHLRLTETQKKMGAIQRDSDPCLFRIDSGEDLTLIIFYVDDILVASKSEDFIRRIKRALSSEFEVNDLGKAKYWLGVEFCQSGSQISMSQRGYILELHERFEMSNCKLLATSIDAGSKLKKNETSSFEVEKLPYRELIGALIYLSTTTRSVISFAISSLGQFNNCYGTERWTAAYVYYAIWKEHSTWASFSVHSQNPFEATSTLTGEALMLTKNLTRDSYFYWVAARFAS